MVDLALPDLAWLIAIILPPTAVSLCRRRGERNGQSLRNFLPSEIESVATKLPPQWRVHSVDLEAKPLFEPFSRIGELRQSFEKATGWPLNYNDDAPLNASGNLMMLAETATRSKASPFTIETTTGEDRLGKLPFEDANELADNVSELIAELNRTRTQLRNREAELATRTISGSPLHEDDHVATRLESVLRGGALAIDCNAAALYVLNEDTSELNLRSSWGLSAERLLEPARPLRKAVADLEALVGHAVVLEDAMETPYWNPPEGFPSGICTPVSTSNQLLGTLWLFADQPQPFGDSATNIAEIVAGRLAAELDRELLLREKLRMRRSDLQIQAAADWRTDRLPTSAPRISGWQLAGWSSPGEQLRGDFFDWKMFGDVSSAVLIGDAHSHTIEGSLEFASLQSTARIYASEAISSREILQRTNESLWSSSSRGQAASLGAMVISPETGIYDFAAAGSMRLIRVSPTITEVTNIETELIGVDSEIELIGQAGSLSAGEVILLLSEGLATIFDSNPDELGQLIDRVQTEPDFDETAAWLNRWYIQFGDRTPTGSLTVVRKV